MVRSSELCQLGLESSNGVNSLTANVANLCIVNTSTSLESAVNSSVGNGERFHGKMLCIPMDCVWRQNHVFQHASTKFFSISFRNHCFPAAEAHRKGPGILLWARGCCVFCNQDFCKNPKLMPLWKRLVLVFSDHYPTNTSYIRKAQRWSSGTSTTKISRNTSTALYHHNGL